MQLYSLRIYDIALTQEQVTQNYKMDKSRFVKTNEYVKTGLMLHYDAINNTGAGYSNSTNIWKDLSGNGNDGTLQNFASNCWSKDCLNFDGIDDWVKITQMDYPNVTLEAIVEFNELKDAESNVLANVDSGGYALQAHRVPYFSIDIEGKYYTPLSTSAEINKKYYISGNYDSKIIKFFQNGKKYEQNIPGTIQYPSGNTIMVLGANPSGQNTYGGYLNGKIYSVRIYNRALTDEEILQNYEMDKERFGITE